MAGETWLRGIDHVALGFAVLAAAQLLLTLLFPFVRRSGSSAQTARADLLRTLLAAVVYIGVFFLYVHFGLGFDITALLATSAALSLIVGLALQATLGNLFAGISIELDRVLRVGDYVRRGTLAGRVVSLGWRSVHMQSDAGSILVVPNSSITSDLLEVIPDGEPYQHEIEFVVSEKHAPGLVMQAATRVLRSGIPGLCEAKSADVVLREIQPDSDVFRYAARFYVSAVAQRHVIGSNIMERMWYELARLEEGSIAHERSGEELQFRANTWGPILRRALGNEDLELESRLFKSAQIRRYSRHECFRERGISLILEGSLGEPRAPTDAAVELEGVLAEVTQGAGEHTRHSRLDYESIHKLEALGVNYVGPMAATLCRRIAQATDDPWVAYRAFAAFLPEDGQRDAFLRQAPRESLRLMHAGVWLGLAAQAAERDVLCLYRAHENSTLFSWTKEDFSAALGAGGSYASSPLAALTRGRDESSRRGVSSNEGV